MASLAPHRLSRFKCAGFVVVTDFGTGAAQALEGLDEAPRFLRSELRRAFQPPLIILVL